MNRYSETTSIPNEEVLEDLLSEPTPEVINTLARLSGDILILGVAGKMGPSLARMARRAFDVAGVGRRVIGVARFSSSSEAFLTRHGIETIRCDLLDEDSVARLPDAENIVFMAGRKFGSSGDEALTWAMNAYLPALVCRRYSASRIVAFSTGNVYGMSPESGGGSQEVDALQPIGGYAMSCVARERMFEYFSRSHGTPVAILRLNYACDLRYGVLVDLAERIFEGLPIELAMGSFNTIWQGDANAMALRAFQYVSTPPWIVNVTGPGRISVRYAAERLAQRMGKTVRFSGTECGTALLSDAR